MNNTASNATLSSGPVSGGSPSSPNATGRGIAGEKAAIEVLRPERLETPIIFASPHSGRDYPTDLLRNSRLDRHGLRQSEDCYVDLLFDRAPEYGAPLLRALFPRAYVDVNRARNEIDPRMFSDEISDPIDAHSNRVISGLGVIPRIVADGHDIYGRKLRYRETRRRLEVCYDPYHRALSGLIEDARKAFGMAIVIDCHSMPSAGVGGYRDQPALIGFVLGDRYGSSCSPAISGLVEETLTSDECRVVRNVPYAGGFVASSYGRPRKGVHVIQIEVNRALYLDEARITRTDGFDGLRDRMTNLIDCLVRQAPDRIWPAQAAE